MLRIQANLYDEEKLNDLHIIECPNCNKVITKLKYDYTYFPLIENCDMETWECPCCNVVLKAFEHNGKSYERNLYGFDVKTKQIVRCKSITITYEGKYSICKLDDNN